MAKPVGKRGAPAMPLRPAHKRKHRKRFTAEQEAALCLEYQRAHAAGDHAAAQAAAAPLVDDLIRLAQRVAAMRTQAGRPYEDMQQTCLIGVMDAIRLFDPSRGARLATLAVWRIRGAIGRFWRKHRDLPQSLSDSPAFRARGRDDAGRDLPDGVSYLPDDNEDVTQDLRLDLRAALDALPKRDRQIIERHWGLSGDGPRTLDDLARESGVTRGRIHQIAKRATNRLAYLMRAYAS